MADSAAGDWTSHDERMADAMHEAATDLPAAVMVPLDETWPTCCDEPMWFRGGTARFFYCDRCASTRAPRPEEVRFVRGH